MQKQIKVQCKAYLVGRYVTLALDDRRYKVISIDKRKKSATIQFAGEQVTKEVSTNHLTY